MGKSPLWFGRPFHPVLMLAKKNTQENPAKDKWTEANGSRGPCYKFTPGPGNGLRAGFEVRSSSVWLDGSSAYVIRRPMY